MAIDEDTRSVLNSIGLAMLGAVLAVAGAIYLNARAAKAAELSRAEARLAELEMKLALVNQQMVPISTAMVALFVKELTHYHTPRMDYLLSKIGPPNTLTDDESAELEVALEERTRDMGSQITEAERDVATMMPMMMKRSRAELATVQLAKDTRLALMTVAAVISVGTEPLSPKQ